MKSNCINFSIIMTLISILISCKQEKNILNLSPNPVIDSISVSEKWNTRSEHIYKVEAKVLDAQGFADIDTVRMEIVDAGTDVLILNSRLYDDGAFYYPASGDVVAGDGVYCNQYGATQIVPALSTAECIIRLQAIDKQGNQSAVENRRILFGPNYPPVIQNVSVPDTFSVPRLRPIIRISVADADGIADISRAYFESKAANGRAWIFESDLYNDGNYEMHGDEVAGDSVFAVRLDSTFMVDKLGSYLLRFYVQDSFQEKNEVIPEQDLFVANTPPLIVNIVMPEIVERPATSGGYKQGFITAQVVDDQGLADIDSVYFYSRKPDSTLAYQGKSFILVDNGLPFVLNRTFEQGDVQAGDGVFSYTLLVYSTAEVGTYTFTFYARDKVGNLSAPQTRTIEIVVAGN